MFYAFLFLKSIFHYYGLSKWKNFFNCFTKNTYFYPGDNEYLLK